MNFMASFLFSQSFELPRILICRGIVLLSCGDLSDAEIQLFARLPPQGAE